MQDDDSQRVVHLDDSSVMNKLVKTAVCRKHVEAMFNTVGEVANRWWLYLVGDQVQIRYGCGWRFVSPECLTTKHLA